MLSFDLAYGIGIHLDLAVMSCLPVCACDRRHVTSW